eukprot:TRINITY_DN1351_c0_g2_i6.p1 TRINITY_DN1351_c0_g2~~TRINITY_DN1351_c0_g2_i6.p1  ORF type:complete len:404 (+),score=114.78 TRINITY_DN1351_c0_g2_i6:147-1214(+)
MNNPAFNQVSVSSSALLGGYTTNNKGKLSLSSTAFMIPHPDKATKGGEDALMISPNGNIVGVADGVGGWADQGVNPSLYSQSLMENAFKVSSYCDEPMAVMYLAYKTTERMKVKGSSTCCILSLKGNMLYSANLGDSGFAVLRDGKIVHKSTPQQHKFNFPYQLGTNSNERPQDSDVRSFKVREGDLIVLASDGFWDNVWTDPKKPSCLTNLIKGKKDERDVARTLAKAAFNITRSKDDIETPFSAHYGETWAKTDDITVVVSRVTSKTARVMVKSLSEAASELNPKSPPRPVVRNSNKVQSTSTSSSSSSSRRLVSKGTNISNTKGKPNTIATKPAPCVKSPSSSSAPVKRWRI